MIAINIDLIKREKMKTLRQRSEMFKQFQQNITKKDTFDIGKQQLLNLREDLWQDYIDIFAISDLEIYCEMPLNKDKTIAYYLYHLSRIEDITSNVLIAEKAQIFFANGFDKTMNSPISTTGNELTRDMLIDFSKSLNINVLKNYVQLVFANTNDIIKNTTYIQSKTKVSLEKRDKVVKSNSVSSEESAIWLIDYWCSKTYTGLFLMPFSRHQMLHLNTCLKILNKIGL